MNAAEEYFMIVVQEESISRAAEKLFLSQQNLSNCIKRLELLYGPLFVRKPRFRLTEEGEALYQTLRQIRVLENSLKSRLGDIHKSSQGTIRFGLPGSRARVLLPALVERFRKEYPEIQLELVQDESSHLEKRLLRGELDLLLGVEINDCSEYMTIAGKKDRIYLVVSEKLMRKIGKQNEDILDYEKWIGEMTFLMNPKGSALREKTDYFFRRRGLVPQKYTEVGDFELQLMLAAQAEGACFCHEMLLSKIEDINQKAEKENRLFAIEIIDKEMASRVTIVRHKYGIKTQALIRFAEILTEII